MACPQRCRYPKRQEATVRCASRLYQLGIGRKYTGEAIRMVITEHCIDASRNCQKPYWKKGQLPLAYRRNWRLGKGKPRRQFVHDAATGCGRGGKGGGGKDGGG